MCITDARVTATSVSNKMIEEEIMGGCAWERCERTSEGDGGATTTSRRVWELRQDGGRVKVVREAKGRNTGKAPK